MILISHVMGFSPLTSLFRKYFRCTAAVGQDAKCDSPFSSYPGILVTCILTHKGLLVNVFFFFLKEESLFFG